jgi:hypothetical protein
VARLRQKQYPQLFVHWAGVEEVNAGNEQRTYAHIWVTNNLFQLFRVTWSMVRIRFLAHAGTAQCIRCLVSCAYSFIWLNLAERVDADVDQ